MRNETIMYCGDTHGSLRHLIDAVGRCQPMAIVLLGDIEASRPLDVELAAIAPEKIWFVHGNHDTDSAQNWNHLWGSKLADRNVHGRVVTLPNGLRLAGLGGVFRGSVWDPRLPVDPRYQDREEHAKVTPVQDRWQGSVQRRHWSTIYPRELNDLSDLRADILVTHEAPGHHPNGFKLLDTLAQSMQVKLSVHGHQHDRLDSSHCWEQQGFMSFGVGLRGISAIDMNGNVSVVVPGERDQQRDFRQRYLDD
jgi:predicted phosphodiesterase